MVELQHVCMFMTADNEHGFIQCTIKPRYRDDFEALGFVDHVSRLKKVKNNENKQRRAGKRNVLANANKRSDG